MFAGRWKTKCSTFPWTHAPVGHASFLIQLGLINHCGLGGQFCWWSAYKLANPALFKLMFQQGKSHFYHSRWRSWSRVYRYIGGGLHGMAFPLAILIEELQITILLLMEKIERGKFIVLHALAEELSFLNKGLFTRNWAIFGRKPTSNWMYEDVRIELRCHWNY